MLIRRESARNTIAGAIGTKRNQSVEVISDLKSPAKPLPPINAGYARRNSVCIVSNGTSANVP